MWNKNLINNKDFLIEAGQIINPECFPRPDELVCIQVPKVFDQVALRDCVTRTVTLTHGPGVDNPVYSFLKADGFDISGVSIISEDDSPVRQGFKRLKTDVSVKYTLHYSDGVNPLHMDDEAVFRLGINEIYCPECTVLKTDGMDGMMLKVDAMAEAFGEKLSPETGLMSLEIGVFFVVKCVSVVRLLVPSYGYCPLPPEQERVIPL